MDLTSAKEILSVIEQLNGDSKESILKALNLAEHVEITSGEFYKLEAQKTKGTELHEFFIFMEKEEEMHLAKILELKAQLENKEELTEIGFEKNAAPRIKSIPAGKDDMTALLYALWREKKAQDFYEQASKKTNGKVAHFFSELAEFEHGHVLLLEEYVENIYNADELIMG
ncbi:MAG: ferritin family protein [archaeon]|jgi:rubrerythrin